ncbi:MAG: hypothetical protein Q6356_003305 [Candidatus Wukongarchaeota archaeon]|nr:hypothetical protein [Candidatus Wukongarchaeota archaeon]
MTSLEEELKMLRQVVPKDRHLDDFVQLGKNYMVEQAVKLLRVRAEKIQAKIDELEKEQNVWFDERVQGRINAFKEVLALLVSSEVSKGEKEKHKK